MTNEGLKKQLFCIQEICKKATDDLNAIIEIPYKKSEMKMIEIKKILDSISLEEESWERDKDIMTFNGKPIGDMFTGYCDILCWWPSLKQELADYLSSRLPIGQPRTVSREWVKKWADELHVYFFGEHTDYPGKEVITGKLIEKLAKLGFTVEEPKEEGEEEK